MADVLCTTPMCADGRTSIQEMRNMFDTLVQDYPDFPRSRFESTVIGLERSFQDAYSVFSEMIPFNPTCCTVKQLGAQADQVTAQMLQAVGGASAGIGPGSTGPPVDIGSIGTTVLWVIGGVLVLQVLQVFKK